MLIILDGGVNLMWYYITILIILELMMMMMIITHGVIYFRYLFLE